MHWCADETMAMLAALPFLGFAWAWIKTRFRKKSCICGHTHVGTDPESSPAVAVETEDLKSLRKA